MKRTEATDGRWRSLGKRTLTVGLYGFAVIGLVLSLGIAAGFVTDLASFDRTSGGYDPPYTDYTGEPIDWDGETYTTATGTVMPGHVVDIHLDCTTGMISFDVAGVVDVDYRTVSDRAIAVHEPHDACYERGFDPQF